VARELRGYQSALDAFDEAVALHLGINRTDLRCLDLLSQHQPMTAGALARASGLTSGAVTFVLDRLERHNFVRRRRDTEDRRVVLVELVENERTYELHAPLVEDFRAGARKFGEAELTVIRDFLALGRELYERHAPLVRARALGAVTSEDGSASATGKGAPLSGAENDSPRRDPRAIISR